MYNIVKHVCCLSDTGDIKVYNICKTAQNVISKIKSDFGKSLEFLNKIQDGKYMFVLNKKDFLYVVKIGPNLFVNPYIHNEQNVLISSNFVLINLSYEIQEKVLIAGGIKYGEETFSTCTTDDPEFKKKGTDSGSDIAIKTLIFLAFAEKEEEVLMPSKKTKIINCDYTNNDTKYKVTTVTSKWNFTSVRLEGFEVGGHFRLQACGEGHKDRKLIWVDSHMKHGYVRKAGEFTNE
jgi:hypothetical protein